MTTTREQSEVDAANASERQPVVFVHGLWLLASAISPVHRGAKRVTALLSLAICTAVQTAPGTLSR